MKESINIGATPPEEDCEQAGPNYDVDKSRRECRAYINQLRRWLIAKGHGEKLARVEQSGEFRLYIKSNPHDFGTYHEVEAKVEEDNEEAVELAYLIDGSGPVKWDEEARKELANGQV
jgi:hypothetical protein